MNSTNVVSGPPRGDGRATLDLRQQAAYLLHEWRLMFRPRTILADTLAAVAVALVALPLSLAISNASGVAPEVGLVTAVVGGVMVALFGGCRLQVSGPAAAMTFLVLEVVTVHGMSGPDRRHADGRHDPDAGGGVPARPLHELHPPAGDRRVPVRHRPDHPLHAGAGDPRLRGPAQQRRGRGRGVALEDAAADRSDQSPVAGRRA